MDERPTWTDCDEAGDYVVPNVLSPRDLVFRPDNMDQTVPHTMVGIPVCLLTESNLSGNQSTVVSHDPPVTEIGRCTSLFTGNV